MFNAISKIIIKHFTTTAKKADKGSAQDIFEMWAWIFSYFFAFYFFPHSSRNCYDYNDDYDDDVCDCENCCESPHQLEELSSIELFSQRKLLTKRLKRKIQSRILKLKSTSWFSLSQLNLLTESFAMIWKWWVSFDLWNFKR